MGVPSQALRTGRDAVVAFLVAVVVAATVAGAASGNADATRRAPEVAVVVQRAGEEAVAVLAQRGSGWRQTARIRVDRGVRSIAWAPNGRKLAVSTGGGNLSNELRVIDLARGGQRALASAKRTAPAAFFGALAWSPDGSRIATTRSMGLYGAELDLLSASTGALIRSYAAAARFDSAITWAKDGKSLYFARQPSARSRPTLQRLLLADGKVVQVGDTSGLDPNMRSDNSLSFTAPDGIRLLERGRERKISASRRGDRFSSWLADRRTLIVERPSANCPRYIVGSVLCSHVVFLTQAEGRSTYLLKASARNPAARG
jgi:dipeptidyl aminopeptidase/acylaminoacyl peptidase